MTSVLAATMSALILATTSLDPMNASVPLDSPSKIRSRAGTWTSVRAGSTNATHPQGPPVGTQTARTLARVEMDTKRMIQDSCAWVSSRNIII